MTTSSAMRLADFVRATRGFVFYEDIDGNYDHMGATVADAVLQANNKYESNVRPRIKRILARYPTARKTSEVRQILQSIPATDFLKWRGVDRANRFSQILDLFAAERVETESDLRQWLSRPDNISKLRAIHGIGPKTTDYFKILVGESTSAVDRHLLNFLGLAGMSPRSYSEAQAIINETADLLGVDRAKFDHSIWQYMSKRGAAPSCG